MRRREVTTVKFAMTFAIGQVTDGGTWDVYFRSFLSAARYSGLVRRRRADLGLTA
jgi:hypothetical protein